MKKTLGPKWFTRLASELAEREGKRKSVLTVAQASEVLGILCDLFAEADAEGRIKLGDIMEDMLDLGQRRLAKKGKKR